MDKLISLQAALEHIVHMELFGRDFPVVPANVLKALPSAQPEIIHCKDCMHSDEDEDEYGTIDRWCNIWAETCEDDGFCNYAKRREDG